MIVYMFSGINCSDITYLARILLWPKPIKTYGKFKIGDTDAMNLINLRGKDISKPGR